MLLTASRLSGWCVVCRCLICFSVSKYKCMGMGGGVNTSMKDKHLNLEDVTCQHNGQPPPTPNKAAQLMVLEPPPPPQCMQ